MSAHAHVTPGTLGFLQAELKIGGRVAYFGTRPIPDDGVWLANWNVHVMFDSTMLPPVGNATVVWTVWDQNMWPWMTAISVPVRNRFASYGRHDFDVEPWVWIDDPVSGSEPYWFEGDASWASVDEVDSRMAAMNHHRFDKCTVPNWDHVRANSGVLNAECLYYASHGDHTTNGFALFTDTDDAINFYESGNNFPTLPPDPALATFLRDTYSAPAHHPVRPVVQAKVGSGTPPFNSGGPPVNLVVLAACSCGRSNSVADAYLWPYRNGYQPPGSPVENKAAVGVDDKIDMGGFRTFASTFYQRLLTGRTVDQARLAAQSAYNSIEGLFPAQFKVWGDSHARTGFLYTGTGSLPYAPRPFSRSIPAYNVYP